MGILAATPVLPIIVAVVLAVVVQQYKLTVRKFQTCYIAKYYYFYQTTDGVTSAIYISIHVILKITRIIQLYTFIIQE